MKRGSLYPVNIRMERETVRRLKREAKVRRLSLSSWIRAILSVPWPPAPPLKEFGPSSQSDAVPHPQVGRERPSRHRQPGR